MADVITDPSTDINPTHVTISTTTSPNTTVPTQNDVSDHNKPVVPSVIKHNRYNRYPKPPYSYIGLIATVILNSDRERASIKQIQQSLADMFSFFKGNYHGWTDSVRHCLSHRDCFIKLPNTDHTRYSYWTVDIAKVPANAFTLKHNKFSRHEDWAPTLHEHLNRPPIVLPQNLIMKPKLSKITNATKSSKPKSKPSHVMTSTTPTPTPYSLNPQLPCIYQQAVHNPYTVDNIAAFRDEILRSRGHFFPETSRPGDNIEWSYPSTVTVTDDVRHNVNDVNDNTPLDLHIQPQRLAPMDLHPRATQPQRLAPMDLHPRPTNNVNETKSRGSCLYSGTNNGVGQSTDVENNINQHIQSYFQPCQNNYLPPIYSLFQYAQNYAQNYGQIGSPDCVSSVPYYGSYPSPYIMPVAYPCTYARPPPSS